MLFLGIYNLYITREKDFRRLTVPTTPFIHHIKALG